MKKIRILFVGLILLACLGLMGCGSEAEPVLQPGYDYVDETPNDDTPVQETQTDEGVSEPNTSPSQNLSPTPTPSPTPVPTKKWGFVGGVETPARTAFGFDSDEEEGYLYYTLGYDRSVLYRTNTTTGAVEVMAEGIGEIFTFTVANGSLYYYDGDRDTWYGYSLAYKNKWKLPINAWNFSDLYIRENILYYVETVQVSASAEEHRLQQVTDFDTENPTVKTIYASDSNFGIERVKESGSFLVTTGSTQLQKGGFNGATRYLKDYIVFDKDGNQTTDEYALRGLQTYTKGHDEIGVGWIGTSVDEWDKYGYLTGFWYGGVVEDERPDDTIAQIFQSDPFPYLRGSVLFYTDKAGIHAYDLHNGKQADISVDPAYTIRVVSGDYLYYDYHQELPSRDILCRVKLDGTGWEEVK